MITLLLVPVVIVTSIVCLCRWLLINDTDPAQQLEWFVDVLQKAEDAGEKVSSLQHCRGDCSMPSPLLTLQVSCTSYKTL